MQEQALFFTERGMVMLDHEKILKIELTTATGRKLVVAQKDQLSFPRMFIDDIPVDNIIIIKGKDFPEFEIDRSLYVITYMKNGDRIRYTGVIKMSLPNQVNVQIRNEYGTLMAERRRYFKVEANLKAVVTGFTRGEDSYELDDPFTCIIRNINIGGIFVAEMRYQFALGDILFIRFSSEVGTVSLMSKIIRVQRNADGEMEGYGCQFVNTDPQQEELLAKLVFGIQLQQRQEQMERDERLAEGLERVSGTQ